MYWKKPPSFRGRAPKPIDRQKRGGVNIDKDVFREGDIVRSEIWMDGTDGRMGIMGRMRVMIGGGNLRDVERAYR